MIRSSDGASPAGMGRDAVLVVNDREHVADTLRRRYPQWEVTTSDTYLSAISSLAECSVRAVVACVEPSTEDALVGAVAGLREAAGERTKLVLCCRAASEPTVRQAIDAGADDYVLLPLRGDELDEALGYARPGSWVTTPPGDEQPVASMDELAALSAVLTKLDAPPSESLHEVAELVRTAFRATGATVVVEGTVATAGEPVAKPVLTEAIRRAESSMGQISLGPRADGAYNHADAVKLRHYATLAGDLIHASIRSRRWRELALTDEVSGLPNRRYLLRFLKDLMIRSAEDHSRITLLLFDIDDFKTYNDDYGHEAGDEIIRGCGELFMRHCRDTDVVTRYGGDEFAVVFWDSEAPRVAGSQHPRHVLPVVERFCQSLREHQFEKLRTAEDACLTISGGLASFPWDATTVDELIVRADEALLRAKREGKNRIYLGGEDSGPVLGPASTGESPTAE